MKHWQSIFEQQYYNGLSISQFCRDHNINGSTFYA
ncbi:IS66 family insertion sequence element accessory protein TnpA [Shewanella sp.]